MFNTIGILTALSACFFVYIHSYGRGIGSQCFLPVDCGSCSVCKHGYCACDDNHIPDGNNVLCVSDILKNCSCNGECFDRNAKCIDQICSCKKGYALNTKKRVCEIAIGFNCSKTSDCVEGTCEIAPACLDKPKNESCNYTQCACIPPLKPTVGGLKCLPDIHKDCTGFNECARENSFCDDKDKICKCSENFKPAVRNNETYCLLMLNNTCTRNETCADDGAFCKPLKEPDTCCNKLYNPYIEIPEKYCLCGPDYVQPPNTTICLKRAIEIHDNCTQHIQCHTFAGSGSMCTDKGKCDCKPGFYFDIDMNRCLRSCVCNNEVKSDEIVKILKDLAPMLDTLAKKNNISIPRLLRRIKNL